MYFSNVFLAVLIYFPGNSGLKCLFIKSKSTLYDLEHLNTQTRRSTWKGPKNERKKGWHNNKENEGGGEGRKKTKTEDNLNSKIKKRSFKFGKIYFAVTQRLSLISKLIPLWPTPQPPNTLNMLNLLCFMLLTNISLCFPLPVCYFSSLDCVCTSLAISPMNPIKKRTQVLSFLSQQRHSYLSPTWFCGHWRSESHG